MKTKKMRKQLRITNYELLVTKQAVFTLVLCLLWLALLPGLCLGAEYYLDAVNGSDSNPGTSLEQAWQTLNHAAGSVSGGDTVYMRAGTYAKLDSENNYGSLVTFEAYQNEIPLVNSIVFQQFSDIQQMNVKYKGLTFPNNNSVYVQGYSHITFEDCNFEGTGYSYPYWSASSSKSSAICLRKVSDITIVGCNIYGVGDSFAVTWPNATAEPEGTDANNFGSGYVYGIYTTVHGATNTIIDNCTIRNCDVGISVSRGINSRFTNNTVYNITSDGIVMSGQIINSAGQETIIANNHVYDLVYFTDPVAGALGSHTDALQFYGLVDTEWQDYINIVVRDNMLHDSQAQAIFARCGGGSENWVVENNLIYNVPSAIGSTAAAVRIRSIENVVFRNNTIDGKAFFDPEWDITEIDVCAGNIVYMLDLYTDSGTIVNYENYNILRSRGYHNNNHELGANSIVLGSDAAFENLFYNYNDNDFTLADDSLAIDFCDPAFAPATDILGVSRDDGAPDAGCYEYVASTFLYGDINGNGEVTAYDAALAARYAVGLEVFTDEQRQRADVSGNGAVSAYDAALIAQKAVGLIDRFPVEE